MTREQFYAWAEEQPRGRFERLDFQVVAMAPERAGHVIVKANVWLELRRAVAAAGVPCQALSDGMTVAIDDDTDYEPDALVNCGLRLDLEAKVAPNPVIIVEVASPSTRGLDAGGKLADYFRLASLEHYLIVRVRPRSVIHHRRAAAGISTTILSSGRLVLDPPGITVDVGAFHEDVD